MKNVLKYFAIAAIVLLGASSCEDFLHRPTEDNPTTAQYYQNDAQVEASVNYLYNAPWYDVIRFFIYGSETMCGNVYQGQNAYSTLTLNGTDGDLKNMSYSLWAVNAQCNTVIHNIQNSTGTASEAVKNKAIGEALAWKAFAYFFLVRTFGDVPIIHDNTEIIAQGTYNEVYKVQKADVYEYIIMTLEKAMELLPKNAYIGQRNRIDYYAAEALLSKVYLTKAGVSGSLDNGDLQKARDYAKDVIDNSGRTLTPKYSDIFRMKPEEYQQTGECLFTWQWQAAEQVWTSQNSIQCDVGLVGFSETGSLWGDWKGPSIDLQEAFGVSAIEDPTTRVNKDDRRQATMMLFGDQFEYFWTDKGGFDFYRFFYDKSYCPSGLESNASSQAFGCATGANYTKHLYGDVYDHKTAYNVEPVGMYNQLPTHILRLGDIYLVYAEACCLLNDSASALAVVNQIRARANAAPLTSVSFIDIWKERRLELALEGDRWYDFVRVSYYDPNFCINELLSQKRSAWTGTPGLDAVCKSFVVDDQGNYVGPGAHPWDASGLSYSGSEDLTNVVVSMFTVPFPTEDVVMNPNVGSTAEAIHVDVRETYSYDY